MARDTLAADRPFGERGDDNLRSASDFDVADHPVDRHDVVLPKSDTDLAPASGESGAGPQAAAAGQGLARHVVQAQPDSPELAVSQDPAAAEVRPGVPSDGQDAGPRASGGLAGAAFPPVSGGYGSPDLSIPRGGDAAAFGSAPGTAAGQAAAAGALAGGTSALESGSNGDATDGPAGAEATPASPNSPPTDIAAAGGPLAENAAGGTVAAILSTTDPDSGDTFTYSITDDPSGLFEIVGDELRVKAGAVVDYETATNHDVTVQVTDSQGNTYSAVINVAVADVDEYDVGAVTDTDAGANQVAENASAGTAVGIAAAASDADATDTVSYSVDDPRFTVDPGGTVRVAAGASFDTETEPSVTVTVTATSSDGSTSQQAFAVNVADVDEYDVGAVTDTDASANSVAENASAGTAVGIAAAASDADATNDTVTYQLVDAGGNPVVDGPFAVDANTGVVTVADNSQLDYESATSQTVYVKAISADGSEATQSFVVNITNAFDEAPTDITYTGGTVDDNSAAGTVVATLSTVDPEAGDSFTYQITNDPSGALEIVGNEIRVKAGSTIDFESGDTQNSVDVTLSQEIQGAAAVGADVTISGVPSGAVLSVGTDNGDGTWTISSGDVADGITITPPAGYYSDIDLTASAGSSTTDVIVSDFTAGSDGFTFNDVAGSYSSGNSASGYLAMTLGGVNDNDITNMEASWSKDFTLSETGTASLGFDYRMNMSSEYESNEYGEIRVKIDGQLVTFGANQYVIHVAGDGNGGLDYDSGWQSASVDLGDLAAGTHTIEFIGFNNQKTETAEDIEVRFDNVDLDVVSPITEQIMVEPISTYDVTVQTTDAGGNSYSEVITINVNDLDDTPTGMTFAGDEALAISSSSVLALNDGGATNEYASASSFSGFPSGDFSFEVAFTMPSSSHDQALVSYATSGDDNEFMMMWTSDNKLKVFIDNSSIDLFPSTTLDDGNEHTVSVTWDQSTGQLLLYIDGGLEDSGVVAQGVTLTSGGTLMFGQEQDLLGGGFSSSQRFEGQLSDARLFSDIRTAQEIADNYDSKLADPSSEQGLVSNWQMNAGGAGIIDQTGSNDLTLNNGATLEAGSGGDTISAGTVVAAASALDLDAGDTFAYALADDAGGKFQIDSNSGEISLVGDHDASSPYSGTVTVQVTDSGGNTYSENLGIHFGTGGNDTVAGTGIDDVMYGLGGNDALSGGGGGDSIYGGSGSDSIDGGAGDDVLYGDGGGDGSVSYSGSVQDQAPVGYWRLSDAGSTVADDSGNGHDGNYRNGAASGYLGALNGDSDTAARFDGYNDYVEIPASTDFQLNEGTVSLWFNADSLGDRQALLSRDSTDYDNGGHLTIFVEGDGRLSVRQQSSNASYTANSGATTVNAGEWNLLTYSWGGGGMKLYLNGELVGANSYTGGIEGNNEPWVIGANQWASDDGVANNIQDHFDGYIDEVALYDSSMSANEMQEFYAAGEGLDLASDTISGGDGNDTLIGGAGADVIDGGMGTDTVSYAGADAAVSADLGAGSGSEGDAAGDSYTSIENIIGSDHDDHLTGDSGANMISAGDGNDTVSGGAGDDTVYLGAGNDTFDTTVGDADLGDGADTIHGGDGADTIWAGGSDDVIYGDAGNDFLHGESGNDTIYGGAGDDTLSGGEGSDLFVFQMGGGTDSVFGGAGGGWTDAIELQDASGGRDLGTFGTDWTLTLDQGSIQSQNADSISLSGDADGTVTLSDGSTVNFFDVERIDF